MKQVRMDAQYVRQGERNGWRWACYQWGFLPVLWMASRVHRRAHDMVLEKRSNRWVIVPQPHFTRISPTQQLLRRTCGCSCKTSGALKVPRRRVLPEELEVLQPT